MRVPAKYVQPVHFEDFNGLQSERLELALRSTLQKHFRQRKTERF